MTNRFETNGTLSSDYGIVKSIENSQSDLSILHGIVRCALAFQLRKQTLIS